MIVYRLKPGQEYSPLKDLPRNTPCVCGSGKKWKVCHLDRMRVASGQILRTHHLIWEAWKRGEDTTKFFAANLKPAGSEA